MDHEMRRANLEGGMDLIIDSHAHTFPYLGDAPGFTEPDRYFAWFQRNLAFHHQPTRRVRDHAVVADTMWSASDLSLAGREDVNFRIGRFGRVEWTKNGEDYYKQYFAPSLQENSCSADYLVAEMDDAGVDIAVLQNDPIYGKLNDFFAACVRAYPDRFLATLHVDETKLDTLEAMAELHRAVEELGHRALYLSSAEYWLEGFRVFVDDPRFDLFWAEVERLGLPVYWVPGASPLPGPEGYLDSARHWANVVERHPTLVTIVANGLNNQPWHFERKGPLPEPLSSLLRHGNFYLELLFPINRGGREEYPFRESLEAVHYLYDQYGAQALVWGSDMPNVVRHCTYSQSLEYLRRHADFIPAADLDLILGGNLARVFKLE
jgi:predicted TIM-barrel fold metal-dependent hydrolase